MTHNKTRSINNKLKKFYLLGIVLVCSFLFMSVEDCENMEMMDEQYTREQAARSGQLRAREKQEQERLAASRQNTQTSQNQQTSGTQQGAQTTAAGTQQTQGGATQGTTSQQGTQAASGGTQQTQGGTTQGATGQGTQAAAGGTQQTQSGAAQGATGQQGTQAAAGGTQQTQGGAAQGATGQGTQTAGGTQQTQDGAESTGTNSIAPISGKTWKLIEIRFTDKTVTLNRNELSAEQADIFTLTIDNERISGRGLPNRYMTSYKAGANNALTIQPIASTMMASIVTEPQRIQEPEYFQYLAKVKSWKINQNRLELTTADAANQTAIMVFTN